MHHLIYRHDKQTTNKKRVITYYEIKMQKKQNTKKHEKTNSFVHPTERHDTFKAQLPLCYFVLIVSRKPPSIPTHNLLRINLL